MLPWAERDVTRWTELGKEARGLRAKQWLHAPDGSQWLRKSHRIKRPCEPAIEALMLRLANTVAVRSADSFVCTWQEGGHESRGLVVRSFLQYGEELTQGADVLKGSDPTYDPNSRWSQTLRGVREALMLQERQGSEGLVRDFAHVLTFDAWIGNADRHQGNWGLITPKHGGPRRLAPMYDPATCLGVELLDDHRTLRDGPKYRNLLSDYRLGCPSGFGHAGGPLSLDAVTRELVAWPEWRINAGAWLARFRSAMDTFRSFLETVPPLWLPVQRKHFAMTLLQERLRWLDSLV
jgi:hypothetical protein